jgi:predicted dehydrogenase
MSKDKLNTAVLGLNEHGRLLLDAASKLDHFHLQAVADKDTNLTEKIADQYKCQYYDDYRLLLTENQFDCLIAAAPLHSTEEFIQMAMKKKCNILKSPPLARNFEEALHLVRLAKNQNIKLAVANYSRFSQSFRDLQQALIQNQFEQIFLVTAFCTFTTKNTGQWQTDPKLAGGGVLLHDCYQMLDSIVQNFDMPQQVYSINTNTAGDRQQRLYSTEDTAILTMKFNDTLIGNLIATKVFEPEKQYLNIHAKDNIIYVSKTRFSVTDASGKVKTNAEYEDDYSLCAIKLLENFALSILSPGKNTLASSADQNLKNMALIDAAYLSERTAMPEEPRRILKMVD